MALNFKNFSQNLKFLRKEKGYTQTKLGELTGVSKQTIISYEKGTTIPNGNILEALLSALEATPEELFGTANLRFASEKELLELYKKRADFNVKAGVLDEDEFRRLIDEELDLEGRGTLELFKLINYFYDMQIKEASKTLNYDLESYLDDIYFDLSVSEKDVTLEDIKKANLKKFE
ncbi:helix-turn-helix transcriptional regulator [Listeria grandensis]|uniref:Helix-turn-helix transcriptional regulator n=2 Tax=Listeria TaxID=1637 RepID=A0A841YYT2_9LIST|nr:MULTISPECIES: helix-turn-helix transcriptional regulator [Listeria]MBC1458495.1 helix-turn-helix transcriptional regulator [Listeria newyorkensis]MBC1935946.1 helix-turn-helix transcriptional regulator [Listeria grandensis]